MEIGGNVVSAGLGSAGDGARPIAVDQGHGATVSAVLAGDLQRFEVLVSEFERGIYFHLLALVGTREDAEDLTQETFARAFSNLGRYDTRRPFRPWLYRIATNLALSHLRRRRDMTPLEGVDVEHPAAPPSSGVQAEEEGTMLRAALEKLPAGARAVVRLFYEEDMKIEEIAASMDRKPGAVKMMLHRARLRLRELIFEGGSRHEP